ncbi:Rha family transcriptional regulator [Bacillus altitudinis]|uniref:Rha family transcriptional regulator n=1 Tax=Bacillus altitudinis TaxID=293387 RepID=UPI00064C57C4|nr:Rha family transcriptional regulator [Bacillus altitudinis]KLV15503.1 kilA [Bacillus altitudinis]
MSELVFVEGNQVVTDSLTISKVFDKRHDFVLRDIEVQIEKLKQAGETDFSLLNFEESTYENERKRKYRKYNLTEDAFALVAMSYTTPSAMKMKIRFINEFKKMKSYIQEINAPSYMIDDPVSRAKRWIAEQEEKQQLQRTLQIQEPLVNFAESCMASEKSLLVREVAKLASKQGILIGERKLFQQLREWKLIFSHKNEPYQEYVNRGYFEIAQGVREVNGSSKAWLTMKITPKGQAYIINRLKKQQAS